MLKGDSRAAGRAPQFSGDGRVDAIHRYRVQAAMVMALSAACGGAFTGALNYPGSSLSTLSNWTGFLLQVDGELAHLNAFTTPPSDWSYGDVRAIAVDDEDSVVVCGRGSPTTNASGACVRNFSSTGRPSFEKLYDPALHMKTVVVDRLMRITVLGDFLTPFSNEGEARSLVAGP